MKKKNVQISFQDPFGKEEIKITVPLVYHELLPRMAFEIEKIIKNKKFTF